MTTRRRRRSSERVRVAQPTRSATATSSTSPTTTSPSSTPRSCHAEAAGRRRARHHPRAVPAADARRRELAGLAHELIDGRGRGRSSAACRSTATARTARRRSTGASACTSAGRGRRTPRATCSATSPTRAARSTTRPPGATRSAASPFPFHSDGSDLVGLFCLDAGAGGGASLVANAVTIHNELVRTEPDARGRAVRRRSPTTSGASRRPGARSLVHDAGLHPARRPAVRALHPPVHRVDAGATPTRPRPSDRGRGPHGPARRHVRRPAVPRVDDAAAGRHAVREQLPRAARAARPTRTTARRGKVRHLKRLWLETDVLADDDKPERFRLGRTDRYWASKGRTKSELQV